MGVLSKTLFLKDINVPKRRYVLQSIQIVHKFYTSKKYVFERLFITFIYKNIIFMTQTIAR
jgi:hypothetical protein